MRDERWERLVKRHADATIFHTRGWLEALRKTYGYEPVVYATNSPEDEVLSNAQVFCHIDSWLTGRRLVALPFSDHADPLSGDGEELRELLRLLERQRTNYKYFELRPREDRKLPGFRASDEYFWHRLSLEPEPEALFKGFQKSCVQRKITRAAREKVQHAVGRSEELLRDYYRLCVLTHRRHGTPPQPVRWFRNLAECLGDMFTIHVAYLNGRAIAGVVMLSFGKSLVYKYGASDPAYHNSGAVPFLFWEAIKEAKKRGCVELDFGRTDLENAGLVSFKEHWGARRSKLTYWRYPASEKSASRRWQLKAAKSIFNLVPAAGPVAGRFLYRHIG
ncbi:MAG: GNAT family N-acetyltransferase [Sciscionella sp.]